MTSDIPARERAVIFDLDGTLVDTGTDLASSANHVRSALDLAPLPAPVVIGYVGDGVQRLLERVLAHDIATGRRSQPVPQSLLATALDLFAEHYAVHLLDATRPYRGVEGVLDGLSDRPLFVATNKPRQFTMAVLDGLDLTGRFERVVGGDDVVRRKPDPAHLAACLEGLDLDPRLAIMVGDSPNDIRAGRSLGARTVAVGWGLVPAATLAAEHPDALVEDATALARELA